MSTNWLGHVVTRNILHAHRLLLQDVWVLGTASISYTRCDIRRPSDAVEFLGLYLYFLNGTASLFYRVAIYIKIVTFTIPDCEQTISSKILSLNHSLLYLILRF